MRRPVFPDVFVNILNQEGEENEFKPSVAARAIINQLFVIMK